MVRVGGVSTRLGMACAAGMVTMLRPAIAGPSTTSPHAGIESHGLVMWCAGQPEPSGVSPSHSALKPSCVDVGFDATTERLVSDAELMELSVDIPL